MSWTSRKKFSNKSVHNTLTLFGRIFEDARKDGYLKVSPMVDLQKTKFTCKKGRALKPDEAQKLLRHTFGSWKIEQGENVLYVSKQMGHKDASITLKVYSHLIKESRPEAAAKTDTLLFQSPAAAHATPAAVSVN